MINNFSTAMPHLLNSVRTFLDLFTIVRDMLKLAILLMFLFVTEHMR